MSDINDIVNQVKQATDYQINRRVLKEKITTELHMTYNNGMFLITPNLLAFLATWPDNVVMLEDIYGNPIEIHREEMLDQARQRYRAVMNRWHYQHAELKRIRKV